MSMRWLRLSSRGLKLGLARTGESEPEAKAGERKTVRMESGWYTAWRHRIPEAEPDTDEIRGQMPV